MQLDEARGVGHRGDEEQHKRVRLGGLVRAHHQPHAVGLVGLAQLVRRRAARRQLARRRDAPLGEALRPNRHRHGVQAQRIVRAASEPRARRSRREVGDDADEGDELHVDERAREDD